MQNSRVLAPLLNNHTPNQNNTAKYVDTTMNSQKNISYHIIEENILKDYLLSSKSKQKQIQKMKARNKIISQEAKVRTLLNQINGHINAIIGNNLTVADVTGKYKPIYKEFERLPYIHFNHEINSKPSHHPNPFTTLSSYYSTTSSKNSSSEDEGETDESGLNLLSDNDEMIQTNYCGHCKKHFVNGTAHRMTGFHQMTIGSPNHWEKIDKLLLQFHNFQ